jgi:hypothetical protein
MVGVGSANDEKLKPISESDFKCQSSEVWLAVKRAKPPERRASRELNLAPPTDLTLFGHNVH